MRALLLLPLPLLLVTSRPADACSLPQCVPGSFVPGDGATIPENAPALLWRPSVTAGQAATPANVRLLRYGDTTPIPFTPVAQSGSTDWELVPQQPLVAGTQYVLEETTECNNGPGARITFTAGPSAALPGTLGALVPIGHGNFEDLDVATGNGSCSVTVGATVLQIVLEHDAESTPWKDLLIYDTLVDGLPYVNQASANVRNAPGASWRGRGKDLLYRICEPSPDALYRGLEPGGHQVAFRAILPGTSQVIATPAQFLEVMCTSRPGDTVEPGDEDGGGCSTTPASAGFVLLALGLLLQRKTKR